MSDFNEAEWRALLCNVSTDWKKFVLWTLESGEYHRLSALSKGEIRLHYRYWRRRGPWVQASEAPQ
jgi:hypothetical protein